MKKAFYDLWGSGENWPEPRSSCVCGTRALLSAPQQEQLFVVIFGDYFRFGVFEIKLMPCLVTVTSLFATCRCFILQMLFSGPLLPR